MKAITLKLALALSCAAVLGACSDTAGTEAVESQQIAWRDGDVNDALAEAQESGKPVLLYWGAEWCPPCAEMKQTLFKDPAFIAKTRDFVPVYLDGDTQGAQKWGDRFGISGYPTVIALSPDGNEITRISSATMASELPDLLTLAAGRTRTIDAVLADAKSDPKSLSDEDWTILGGFAWGNDPARFKENGSEADLLEALAANAPDDALKRRFGLLALTRKAEKEGDGYKLTAAQEKTLKDVLPGILASRDETIENRYELASMGGPLVSALPAGGTRDAMAGDLRKALEAIYADKSLTLLDRTYATYGEVLLVKGTTGLSDELKAKVRVRMAAIDKAADDPIARKSVISYTAMVLDEIGDRDAATRVLMAEIDKSASPYYYMAIMADRAAEDEQPEKAVEWARKAYEAAEGPATRVQWAVSYAMTVMDQTPKDDAAVEASADAVLAELAASPDGYYQRTQSAADRWGKALVAWSEEYGGSAVLNQVEARMADVCAKQGDKAEACGGWMKSA
ncbi:thioredoxin family protein [Croceicoccus pelagius]|uniref:Thiol reductase thioredoxin n=1 Tax=Croceicoccus pelagius TaxID=1703341 RepID=A0A917DLQ7_9SPHN|nr:thioredoxin family protein [Croceicoccus pelagius]GGD49325.1 thiol reductase thioredoxin [Croceicoccus pelagius]